MQTLKRNLGLDLFRILMAVMVVALHTHWLSQLSPLADQLTVNGLFRMAVPAFFLINGYYAFETVEGGKAKPWLARILQIYCFWAVVYFPAYLPHHLGGGGMRDLAGNVAFGFRHLWYMVALALAGAVLWLVHRRSSVALLCLAAVLFAVGLALELGMLSGGGIPVRLYRNFLFDALPFILMGYLLRREKFDGTRPLLWVLATLGLAGLLLESLLEGRFAAPSPEPDLYVSLLLLCPAVFLLVRRLRFTTAQDRWAKTSSAIYFSHLGFLLVGERLGIAPGMRLFAFVLLLSVLASWPLIALSRRLRFVL